MKFYIAAPYAARSLAKKYADELNSIGMECTSAWVNEQTEIKDGTVGAATELTDDQVAAHVRSDLRGVSDCDVLVHLTPKHIAAASPKHGPNDLNLYSGGRHVETGYAIALNKKIVVIGEPENVFLRGRITATDWHDAVLKLVRLSRPTAKAARA